MEQIWRVNPFFVRSLIDEMTMADLTKRMSRRAILASAVCFLAASVGAKCAAVSGTPSNGDGGAGVDGDDNEFVLYQ